MKSFSSKYLTMCQKIGAAVVAPSAARVQVALFAVGIAFLTFGLSTGVLAQFEDVGEYNDDRFAEAITRIITYLEGSFGALVMIVAGLGAILSAAFGQYRAAIGALIIAVGTFILRSFVSTFFNVDSVNEW